MNREEYVIVLGVMAVLLLAGAFLFLSDPGEVVDVDYVKWELIGKSPDSHGLYRSETPWGWLIYQKSTKSIIYMPDPAHSWELEDGEE